MFPDGLSNYEEVHSSTLIANVMNLRVTYQTYFTELQKKYHVQDDEFEHLYDWMIIEAFTNTHLKTSVHGHYKHDVYLQVYQEFKTSFESWLYLHHAFKGITFENSRTVKALVAGPNFIVVIQRKMYE